MSDLLFMLSLPPILRGLAAMTMAGVVFPATGVMVLRMGLVPMRYMLMHGVILGGALALALSLPMFPVVAVLNLALVLLMVYLSERRQVDLGMASAALMVFTMGMASLLMHIWDVPAKDTLELMWGSPFALVRSDLVVLGVLTALVILYVVFNFRKITTVFFDREIARSLGVNVRLHHTVMVVLVALVVAVAMKLLGALLIDALLILPVLIASRRATSMKQVFAGSIMSGAFLSLVGYISSVWLDLPVSGTISVLAVLLFICVSISSWIQTRRRNHVN
jgi:zinc transport system permease protein